MSKINMAFSCITDGAFIVDKLQKLEVIRCIYSWYLNLSLIGWFKGILGGFEIQCAFP